MINSKKMILMTLQNREDGLHYVFEEEDHYMYEYRYIHYQISLDTTDKGLLLQDKKLQKSLGFKIANALWAAKKTCDTYQYKYRALIAYQYEKNGKHFINIDKETYKTKSNRKLCASIPTQSKTIDDLIKNDAVFENIGKAFLECLSINPDEKYEDYKHLITDFKPYRFEEREA